MKSLIHTLTLLSSLSFLIHATYGSATPQAPHAKLIKKHRRGSDGGPQLSQKLFPDKYTYYSGFTTAFDVFVPGVYPVPLNDTVLNVIRVQKGVTRNVVWQNGKIAWEAVYPEGSTNPSSEPLGGIGLYLGGADEFFDKISNGAEEVILSYSVMFEDGFEFNMGGKLPGPFGGDGSLAFGCSGGRQENRSQCFDARLMWRTDGAGEIYTYLPITDANKGAQIAVPGTVADDAYGYSVGRGAFYFPTGEWVTVAERVKFNTVGGTDGLIDLWVNGNETIKLRSIALREDANATIQGSHFQTFFGGSGSEWASPKTQKAWFADVSGAIIKS